MIVNPEKYFTRFRDAGADHLTIHMEACNHLHRAVQEIHELGMKAGVALNPHTPVSSLEEIIPFVDQVLIMSVNPGFGGQEFIPTAYEKIRKARTLIDQSGCGALIEVDGGIDLHNAGKLFYAGANILVAGTTIFHSPDISNTIKLLKSAI
jgi:ribulose-phosphate 3-epimerase